MIDAKPVIGNQFARITGVLLALFMLGACSEVRLLSEYDSYTDEAIGKLHRSTEELFTQLERHNELPDCKHSNHEDYYETAAVDLNVLIARNSFRPKNRITNDQLALLKDSINSLEDLHRLADSESRCLSIEEIAPLRSAFDSSFTAILKLEMAKKRGDEENQE